MLKTMEQRIEERLKIMEQWLEQRLTEQELILIEQGRQIAELEIKIAEAEVK